MLTAPRNAEADPKERELFITRVFNAPRPLVFKAWTDPRHLAHWWGPKGFTVPVCRMDVREGGAYHMALRSPEGKDHWIQGTYSEIVEPERLVFTWAWEDEEGRPGHQTVITVTLAEHGKKTKMFFHQAVFPSIEQRDNHGEGWNEALDRLAAYLLQA